MTPEVSVIVPTHNRADQVSLCVDCLLGQDLDPSRYELIVVDDGSTDGTAARLDPARRRGPFSLVCLSERRGAGPARNVALATARGAVVVFVDSDAFAPPWFVRTHLDAHRRRPWSIVDGPAITVPAFAPGAFRSSWVRTLAALDVAGKEFITVNTSCPRAALERAGGFDEEFGLRHAWEDVELGRRLRQLGLGRIKVQAAYVLHVPPVASLEAQGRKEEECGANAILYYAKHPSAAAQRRIRANALWKQRILHRLGLPASRLAALARGQSGGAGFVVRPLARSLFLLQRYADGLRLGMAERGISSFR